MAAISRFEDIEAWKQARVLTRHVYRHTSAGEWARDYALRDQIRRSSLSVLSNIAEGYGRQSDQEFHRFLCIARGSAAEAKAQLYVALDQGYLDEASFTELAELADKVSRLISGFMNYLGKRKD